jgi:hypothetical protein
MMKQSQRGVRKNHPMLDGRPDTFLIHNAPTRRRQILHPTLPRPVHIIREGEECIAGATYSVQLARPHRPLLRCQRAQHTIKLSIPCDFSPSSSGSPQTNKSIALAFSVRFTPFLNGRESTRGWCRSHQLSAFKPARRVQWMRDCWPAPRPMMEP